MAFWRRIKQSQIHVKLWNQFTTTRSYLQIRSPVTVTVEPTRIWSLNSSRLPAPKPLLEVPTNVRFFAKKKFKSKPKPKEVQKEEHRPRLNEEITADEIRLVTDEGHSIMSRHAALKLARSLELDLVEVQRNVTPPVCKIKDYLKEKYVLDTKEKERAKEKSAVTIRQGACKEIRFSGKITQKDLEVKADAAKRLMESGYRVKCVALGNVSSENGESSTKLISRFSALIEDSAVVESHTRVEDKDQTHVIMRHVKYGSLKKGSVKKANRCAKEMADTDAEEEENPGRAAASANNDCDQLFDIPENLGNVSQKPNDETLLRAQGSSRYSSASGHSNYASHGGRETPRPSPEFSNVARQPQPNMNASPQSRGTEQGFGEFSISRSPPNTPRFPSAPNFGIFSTPENAAEKRGGPAEVNRYKQRTGSDSQRNSSPPRPMGHGNRGISGTGDGSPQVRQSHR